MKRKNTKSEWNLHHLNGCREQEGAEQKNKPATVKTSSLFGEWEQKTERNVHIMISKSCGKLLMCRMVPLFFSTLALFLGLFEFGHVSIKWNKYKCCYFGFLLEICFYFSGSRVRAVATLLHLYVFLCLYFVRQSALSHNHYTVTMPSVILPIIRKVFMFSCA